MSAMLERARRLAAEKARERFDFGGVLVRAEEWMDDRHDRLYCDLEIGGRPAPRCLTFRVAFAPGSDRVNRIEVAERLAAI